MNRLTRLVNTLNSPESLRFFTAKLTILSFRRCMGQLPPESSPTKTEGFDSNPMVRSLRESIGETAERLRGDDVVSSEGQKRELPEELSRNVMRLTCKSTIEGGTCVVYVVGTSHVSKESCSEVQAVISYLKPQVVFLELCQSRVAVLTPRNLKVPTMREMLEMLKKEYNIFGVLYSWFLAKVATKLEIFPGSEFRMAFEEAMKYGGKVVLGDRLAQITLQRTWEKMPLRHKFKLLYSFLFQAAFLPRPKDLSRMLKELDDVDMMTLLIKELSMRFPTLLETIVHERDQYMSSKLLEVASENSLVVAVVGKGHLQGIKSHWKQPVDVNQLLEIPSQKKVYSATKILVSTGVAAAGIGVISVIYLACK